MGGRGNKRLDYKRGKDEEIGAWIGKSLKRIEREKGRE